VPSLVVLLEHLRVRHRHHEVGLFLRRDLAVRPAPDHGRGLDLGHPADRFEDAGHPVGPPRLAIGEHRDAGRPLHRDVLLHRPVLNRPQLTLGDLGGPVRGPRV